MLRAESTRLRYVSSPSPEGLELILNSLPFKVEIKSVQRDGKRWFAWFVLPDNVNHETFNKIMEVLELKARQNKALKGAS